MFHILYINTIILIALFTIIPSEAVCSSLKYINTKVPMVLTTSNGNMASDALLFKNYTQVGSSLVHYPTGTPLYYEGMTVDISEPIVEFNFTLKLHYDLTGGGCNPDTSGLVYMYNIFDESAYIPIVDLTVGSDLWIKQSGVMNLYDVYNYVFIMGINVYSNPDFDNICALNIYGDSSFVGQQLTEC